MNNTTRGTGMYQDSFAKQEPAPFTAVKDKVMEVKENIGQVTDMIIEAKDKAIDRGSSLLASLKRTVEDRPLSSVAIAFLVGYVGMRVTRPLRWL